MKNLCTSCVNLLPRGIIITEPAQTKGVVHLQSPRINGVCHYRNFRMDNISAAACPQYTKKYESNDTPQPVDFFR